jgi:tetratricopeptide (TPR) repeat protein
LRKAFGWAGVVVVLVASAAGWHVWRRFDLPSRTREETAVSQGGNAALNVNGSGRLPSAPSEPPAEPSGDPGKAAALPREPHPLLKDAEAAVLVVPGDAALSTARPELAEVAKTIVASVEHKASAAPLTIDYPLDQTIFPPKIVPPTFLWHEPTPDVDTWLIDVGWSGQAERILVLSAGSPSPAGPIDPECISKYNEIYQPTPYQASARSWTPEAEVWALLLQRSAVAPARVTICGLRSAAPDRLVSRGEISITTSRDPVGAPIFYRDVPLAPTVTQKGVIAPLGEYAVGLIGWRLRDVSLPESRLLFHDVPTCTNCHSFSSDGKTMGMDLDGPNGDKGAYVLAPIARETVIETGDVISWNSFPDKPEGHKTIGFLSRVSPDGQHVATTLNEEVFVTNFLDYKFLQVFYPTRGILGYYSRSSGEIKALPGADDPKFVHCDPVWTPDGEHLVFARAEARDAYAKDMVLPERANDAMETPIQYDLYRMPFAGGRGGRPEPIAGASANGMSNNFPKVSPDGKWIVFVKCRNGQLMRPDSTLWIVPATGGTARKMRCNTRLMNSWHSFSPNGRWMVFSSKANTPYTQMFLTHIDEEGNDSPPVLIPGSTAANRAVNLPEFVNRPYEELVSIRVKALEHLHYGLRGVQLARQGKLDEAMAELESAIKLQPDYWQGHVNAAVVLIDQGKLGEAMARLQQVLKANPDRPHAYGSVGVVLARQGMDDEAVRHFQKALELDPAYTDAHSNLAKLLQKQGKLEEATAHFVWAMDLRQDDPLTHFDLAGVLLQRQMIDLAIEHLQRAVDLDPQLLDAHLALTKTHASQGNYAAAVAQLEKTIEADPNNLRPVNDLAWLLAVCPDDEVRDGDRAVQLAERACRATRHSNPVLLGTLAAAYAEVGRFDEAADTATKALDLVVPQDKLLAEGLRRQLQLYRSGKPCRDSRGAPD